MEKTIPVYKTAFTNNVTPLHNTAFINKAVLHNLLSIPSVGGYEKNITDYFCKNLCTYSTFEFSDNIGNACVSVGVDKPKYKIMLSAHIDEIGMQVQHIDKDGFIHFIPNGGIDKKVLLGAHVDIITEKGIVKGVIGKCPIHIEYHSDNKDKATEIKDMKIDCGFESSEEAKEIISIGDPIVVHSEFCELGQNRFTSRGLDDKAGVFVMIEVMKTLSNMKLNNVKVYGVVCTQEETSASGAVSAAARIDPDYSIDYDVTFATDDDYVSPNEWGDVKLGKGGAIAYGPDSNIELSKMIKSVCKKNSIPFQEFCVGSGFTDTVHIKQSSFNAKTALLSIPNRNMHTQAEVCDYRDLKSLIAMTVATIAYIDSTI